MSGTNSGTALSAGRTGIGPTPVPGAGAVDVWRIGLDAPRPGHLDLLSPAERERADRFRFDAHRQRFVTGRAAVREILAGYVGIAPGELRFGYGRQGKPHLAEHPEVHFNLSNTDRLALLAVGSAPLGIDVEDDPAVADLVVAEHFFTPDELTELEALPPAGRPLGFLTCWTRKEAYLKAKGGGLSAPLDAFAVSLTPGAAPKIRWSRLDPPAVRYDVIDLSGALPAGGAAALVVRASTSDSTERPVSINNHRAST